MTAFQRINDLNHHYIVFTLILVPGSYWVQPVYGLAINTTEKKKIKERDAVQHIKEKFMKMRVKLKI